MRISCQDGATPKRAAWRAPRTHVQRDDARVLQDRERLRGGRREIRRDEQGGSGRRGSQCRAIMYGHKGNRLPTSLRPKTRSASAARQPSARRSRPPANRDLRHSVLQLFRAAPDKPRTVPSTRLCELRDRYQLIDDSE